MCGVDKVYRHLPERVKRKYGYVKNVPRHLTDVVQERETHIVQAFIDFRTDMIKEDVWGNLKRLCVILKHIIVPENEASANAEASRRIGSYMPTK